MILETLIVAIALAVTAGCLHWRLQRHRRRTSQVLVVTITADTREFDQALARLRSDLESWRPKVRASARLQP